MFLSRAQPERTAVASSLPLYRRVQHRLLGLCILLAPLTLTVYLMTWINVNVSGSSLTYSQSIAALGTVPNHIHMIFGILATIFLPLGFFGMALLGMKRAPWLATIAAIFALVGWAPFGSIWFPNSNGLCVSFSLLVRYPLPWPCGTARVICNIPS